MSDALAAAAGRKVLGHPGDVYLVTSEIAVTGDVGLDLNGDTLKPSGTSRGIFHAAVTATASTTVSSGATIGSRQIVVASATGIAAGQWVRFYANDEPTNDSYTFPAGWAKVTNVAGTTITLDSPLQVTYTGTINVYFYNAALIHDYFKFRGRIDGSATTYNTETGIGLRVTGYENVEIDADLIDFDNADTRTTAIQVFTCVDARVTFRSSGTVSQSNLVDVQDCSTGHVVGGVLDGDGFGFNISRCDFALAAQNSLRGCRKQNRSEEHTSELHSRTQETIYIALPNVPAGTNRCHCPMKSASSRRRTVSWEGTRNLRGHSLRSVLAST